MEGNKRKLIRSLRLKLCVALTVIGIIYTGFSCYRSYNKTKIEAAAFIDEELAQIAGVIVNYDVILPKSWEGPSFRRRLFRDMHGNLLFPHHGAPSSLLPMPSLNDLFDKHQEIMVAPLFAKPGETFYFPSMIEDGIYTVLIKDKRVRAYVSTNKAGIRFVVARSYDLLDEVVNQALLHSLSEFLLLLIIYVPSTVFLVNVIFRPVKKVASELDARKHNDLSPIRATKLPSELDIFIESINRLFTKTSGVMQNERRFIADAAHELRTPLTAISLQAQAIHEGDLPPEEAEKMRQLKQAIARQRTLTNNLLEYARSQCGHVLKLQNFSIKDIFIEVIDEIGFIADRKNIDLGLEGDCDILVYTDRTNVKTIVTNLVSNALKYTPDGGRCDLSCEESADKKVVSIYVDDTGPGLLQKDLELVFNAFYRVGGDSAKVEGTGLGLSIVKSACDEINGRIELSNRKKGGLRAAVTIPKRNFV